MKTKTQNTKGLLFPLLLCGFGCIIPACAGVYEEGVDDECKGSAECLADPGGSGKFDSISDAWNKDLKIAIEDGYYENDFDFGQFATKIGRAELPSRAQSIFDRNNADLSDASSLAYFFKVDERIVYLVVIWDTGTMGARLDVVDATDEVVASALLWDDGTFEWVAPRAGLQTEWASKVQSFFETSTETSDLQFEDFAWEIGRDDFTNTFIWDQTDAEFDYSSPLGYDFTVDDWTVQLAVVWDPDTMGASVDLLDLSGSVLASGAIADDGTISWTDPRSSTRKDWVGKIQSTMETLLEANDYRFEEFAFETDRDELPERAQAAWDELAEQVEYASPAAYTMLVDGWTTYLVVIWDPDTMGATIDVFGNLAGKLTRGDMADDGTLEWR